VQHRPQHLVVDALAVTVDKFFSSAEASIEVELRKIEPQILSASPWRT